MLGRFAITLVLASALVFPAASSAVDLRYPVGGEDAGETPQFEWTPTFDEDSLGIETSASPVTDPNVCTPTPPPGCFADSTSPGAHFFRVFPDDTYYRVDEDDAYPPGTYYWHVLVEDEVSGDKYFSRVESFTVLPFGGQPPAQIKKVLVKYYSCSDDILVDVEITEGAPAKWRLDFFKGRHGRSVFHYDGRAEDGLGPFKTGNAPRQLKTGRTYFAQFSMVSAGIKDKSKLKRLKIKRC